VLVKGLYLQGAGWDMKSACLVEAEPMQLVCPIPTIHFRPVETKRRSQKGTHARAMWPNNVTIARITQTDQRPFPLAVYDCHCSWRIQIIYVVFFAFAIEVIFLFRFVCCFANSSVGLFTWQIVDDFLLYLYYYVIHYIRESVDYMSYTTWFMHKIT